MDVIRLDGITFKPDGILIEGYDSMIWTERYVGVGEFEMRSSQVDKHRALLPEDTLISHLGTREVMVVETSDIDEDEDGIQTLVVRGRSFESILEYRPLFNISEANSNALIPDEDGSFAFTRGTPAQAAAFLIRYAMGIELLNHDARYDIANVTGVSYDPVDPQNTKRTFKNLLAMDEVLNFCAMGGHGLRNSRPINAETMLEIQVYKGLDRTTGNDPVTFSDNAGDFVKESYLWSTRDYRNVAYVFTKCDPPITTGGFFLSGKVGRKVYAPWFVEGSGRSFRPLMINLSTPAITSDFTTADRDVLLQQSGLAELAKHNKVQLLNVEITPNSKLKYGINYFLGDTVQVVANYGLKQKMLVAEHIRIEDDEGDRAYPTLGPLS